MLSLSSSTLVLTIAIVLLLARPAHAFGAGNIASVAKIEGLNWRHGDIEDTLLTLVMSRATGKKFDKMSVARVYFGNWLRDYSQAIDVGTVKYVSAEAIRILLWVLGFMTFGFGTKEFEVTTERLGCYRPEDHIDNPKDYADNVDATQYDRRLRGPVNERVELAIDPRTGMKNYIANEQAGIMTSALHVRKLFTRCIQLGRSYNRSGNKDELYESLRLLGTGLHCLEDFSAHSNYTELALIELGERDVFPHVGRDTQIHLQGARGPVYPIVTGTFGGVDFLHSVMGEVSDKATQSEIQELEGSLQHGERSNTSALKDLLSKLPEGLFGGKDEAGKAEELEQNATTAQMNQTRVSPRQPEEFTRQMQHTVREIYPIVQWHDEVMLSITETIERIPILPELLQQFEEQVNIFVFSLLAPFVLPIITQIKTELSTGSSEIIQSSKDAQLIVFHDDRSTDPTHSMLSKDHFSNILNEPAGKIASQVLKWAVPQIVDCWDNDRIDPERTIDRIINGVFHHPAQRQLGEDGASDGRQQIFSVVEQWWGNMSQRDQQQLRRQLSREGVQNGQNHKPGVHDSGHGCGKPLGMAKTSGGPSSTAAGAVMGGLSSAFGGSSSGGGGRQSSQAGSGISNLASEAVGGGALGGVFGAIAGGIGGSLLSGAFGGGEEEKKAKKSSYSSSGYTQDGGYQQSYTETGRTENKYAQAQYSETQLPSGGHQTEYQRYEQGGSGHGGAYEQRTEARQTYGGDYEQTTQRRQEYGHQVETEIHREGRTSEGREYKETKKYKSKKDDDDDDDDYKQKKYKSKKDDDDDDDYKQKKYKSKKDDDDDDDYKQKKYKSKKDDDDHDDSDDSHKKKKKEKKKSKYDADSGDDSPKRYSGSGGYGGGGYQKREKSPERQSYGGRDRSSERRQGGGGYQQRERSGERQQQYGGRDRSNERRQEYGGGRDRSNERRQEYGGGGGGYGGGYGGGQQQQYGSGRDEYRNTGGEYGSTQGGYDGGYSEPRQQNYGGGQGGFGGGGYASRDRDDEYRQDDYRDEREQSGRRW